MGSGEKIVGRRAAGDRGDGFGDGVSRRVVHDKVRIFKMRRRKHYQKHQGHRQNYTELFVRPHRFGAGRDDRRKCRRAPAAADDLAKIEGHRPEDQRHLLAKAGITTFAAALRLRPADRLKELLGGRRAAASQIARSHHLGRSRRSWPPAGDWDAFKKLTDELVAGKRA